MCIPKGLKLTDIMAQVKHVIKNGIVNLKQAVSGRKTGINVSLYEYVDEEDKPQDEYIFNNDGASSLSFSADGHESETCKIRSLYGNSSSGYSDTPFSCTDKPGWVNVETVQTGNTQITVTVDANSNYSERSGQITLTQSGSDYTLEIQVHQDAEEHVEPGPPPEDDYKFDASQYVDTHSASGETETITITSTKNGVNHPWSISSQPSGNWVSASADISRNVLTITTQPNTSTSNRQDSVTIRQNDSNKEIEITIYQDGEEREDVITYELNVNPDSLHVDWAANGNKNVVVTSMKTVNGDESDVEYDTVFNGCEEWCHADFNGNPGTFAVSFDTNDTGSSRSGSIVFTQREGPMPRKTATLSVSQDAKPESTTYVFTAEPSAHTFTYDGGTFDFTITSYSERGGQRTPERWKLKSDENADWISGQDASCAGSETQQITITCQSWTETTKGRTCNLVFEQDTIQPSDQTVMVVISQNAKPEETIYGLIISPDSINYSPGGGQSEDITITSTANTAGHVVNAPWKYSDGAATWISGYPTSGTDPQTFKIDCQNNTTTTERQCTLRYVQESPGTATATLRIVQSGMSLPVEHTYVFDAEPSTLTFKSNSDNKAVTVTSTKDGDKCNWSITAGNDSDWCHLSTTDTGLTVNVDENKTGEEVTQPRNLEVTLSQQDSGNQEHISISQEGYTPPIPEKYEYTFTVSPNNHITLPVRDVEGVQLTVSSYKTGAQSGVVELDFTHTEDSEWIKVSGEGGSLTVSADDNNTGADRSGTIDFKQSEQDETGVQKSVVISVTQKGSEGIGA